MVEVQLTYQNILRGIAGNLCPHCLKGSVFRGIFVMNTQCSQCGFVFEKEPGYFLGAAIIAYFLGVFSVVPTILICLFMLKLEIAQSMGVGIGQILILQPFLYRYSKLSWIYLENRMTSQFDKM